MQEETERQAITISVEAAKAVQDIITEKNMAGHALRIYVAGSSCSGVQFGMALDKNINDTDTTLEMEGVKIVVDPQSLEHTYGANIDFINDPQKGAGFIINNPNAAQGGCGCNSGEANSCGGGNDTGCGCGS